MQVYILMFGILIILSSISIILRVSDNKKIYLSYFIIFIMMGLIVGYRDSFGLDDAMYKNIFYNVSNSYGINRQIESSYLLICKIVSFLGLNYQAVYLIYSLISYYSFYKGLTIYVSKNNQRILFNCLFCIFFFLDSFVLMRQFLAVSLIFLAYSYKGRRRIILFILSVFIHKSALIAIIPMLLYKIFERIKYKQKVIILGILYILQYIPYDYYIGKIGDSLSGHYGNYFIRTFLIHRDQWYVEPLSTLTTLLLGVYIISLYFYSKEDSNYNSEEGKIYMLGYYYFVTYMIFSRLGRLNRFSWYFMPFAIISCCYILNYIKLQYKQLITIATIVFSFTFFYNNAYNYKIRNANSYNEKAYIFREYDYNLDIIK